MSSSSPPTSSDRSPILPGPRHDGSSSLPPPIPPARLATPGDVQEILRLAATAYASRGLDLDEHWRRATAVAIREHLGRDAAVYVVDSPSDPGLLAASGAGVIEQRDPRSADPTHLVGRVQWVATDARWRRAGYAGSVLTSLLAWFETRNVPTVELRSENGESLA